MIALRPTKATYVLFLRNLTIFMNQFFIQIFEGLIQPVLYLLCFGYVMGSWFDITAVSSYTEFVYIGILIAIPMSIASYETNYTSLEYLSKKNFHGFLNILPIKQSDVFVSSFLWSIFKSLIIMSAFLFIGTALKLISVYDYLDVLFVGFIVAAFFSSLTMFIAVSRRWNRSDFHKILYILIPAFLFSGVFFPVDILPIGLKQIAHYNPLGFSLQAIRNGGILEFTWVEVSIFCTFLLLSSLLLNLSLRLQKLNQYKPQ